MHDLELAGGGSFPKDSTGPKKLAIILLVEDDRALLEGIADLLEVAEINYDIQVLTASNGQHGLAVLDHQTPDLIISDIMMPRMGGFEFLKHVRANPAWVNIPVIFLTARGTRRDILEGRLSGAELYITKPYDNDELIQLVESQLDRAFELQHDRQRRLDTLGRNVMQLLNHEFRTPLTYLTAYSQMLADDVKSRDVTSLPEYLRGIQVGTARLNRLVDDLLTVMELRTGEAAAKFRQRAQPIHGMSRLLEAFCQLTHSRYSDKNTTIHCRIASQLPPVFGDKDDIVDVCDRLVDNAIRFSTVKRGSRSVVTLSADEYENEVRIRVQDNGLGLPEHVHNRVFELFFQHDRETLEQQGAGAGLTIAKGLVDLHGGRILIDSVEGVGSTFEVRLPVYESAGELERRPEKSSVGKTQATVLIVEDEWYLLDGLRDLMETIESDYELRVVTALNGKQGLKVMAKFQPDLIVSDIMMPYMDGYEFLRQVRQNPAWVHIPFIFLTAKGERQDILRGRRSGVEEYITKPYNSSDLFSLMIAQLDRHFKKQSVLNQDFEELKRGILDALLRDLRSPLDAMSDYSEKLAARFRDVQTDADLKAYLQEIQAASGRVFGLVEDFIYLAELRTGEAVSAFDVRAMPGNVSVLLSEAGHAWQGKSDRKHIQFHRDLALDVEPALIDRAALANCFERLIDVAVELSEPNRGLAVNLTSAQMGDKLILKIGTEGGRVPVDNVDQINSLFGNGVADVIGWSEHEPGLAIVNGIVQLHGGSIHLDCEADQRETFVVTLPTYQPSKKEAA